MAQRSYLARLAQPLTSAAPLVRPMPRAAADEARPAVAAAAPPAAQPAPLAAAPSLAESTGEAARVAPLILAARADLPPTPEGSRPAAVAPTPSASLPRPVSAPPRTESEAIATTSSAEPAAPGSAETL